jgi:hypothetical protein
MPSPMQLLKRSCKLMRLRYRQACIYDPYYCRGASAAHLKSIGFPNVINNKASALACSVASAHSPSCCSATSTLTSAATASPLLTCWSQIHHTGTCLLPLLHPHAFTSPSQWRPQVAPIRLDSRRATQRRASSPTQAIYAFIASVDIKVAPLAHVFMGACSPAQGQPGGHPPDWPCRNPSTAPASLAHLSSNICCFRFPWTMLLLVSKNSPIYATTNWR